MRTHTRTETELGPDYCYECSEAIHDWVAWPCVPAVLLDDREAIAPGDERYHRGADR